MATKIFHTADMAGLVVGAALMAALTGCLAQVSTQPTGYRAPPVVQAQATVVIADDYDYYPAYETYYSRNRHEFVYRDGNTWVRRPEPRGFAANVVLAAPSVRLDFHDSPEQHHASVARTYPKNWTPPGGNHPAKDNHKPDNKDDRRDDRKN
jgi:hypothetical protein